MEKKDATEGTSATTDFNKNLTNPETPLNLADIAASQTDIHDGPHGHMVRIPIDDSNRFMSEGLEHRIKIDCLKDRLRYRVAPFVEYSYLRPFPGVTMPAPDEDDDSMDESCMFDLTLPTQAIRVMIRPDVETGEAIRLLKKIIDRVETGQEAISNELLQWIADEEEDLKT